MSRLRAGSSIGPFPYRVVKQLGAGSGNMSDVYLATFGDPENTSSFVVIKISKAQEDHSEFFEDTIFNEAERLRKLDHRGVVRILPIQTDNHMRVPPYSARAGSLPGNPWFLVLEHLVGDSLADVLQNYKQLDIALAVEITRKIAQTLEYLHYNDLVHLDLKPENILFRRPLENGGRVEPVLIDFGIARNTGQAGLEGRTLHYAPPERVLNNRGNAPPETLPRPSPAMDIYSLGVVFYQMLAGRRPFEGRTARSISSAILEGKPTNPSKYSNLIWKELDDLVMEMLNRDPIRRPTAGELVERLDELRSKPAYQLPTSPSGQSVQISSVRRRSSFAKIGRAIAIAVLFLLLALGGGEAYSYSQTGALWQPTLIDLKTLPATTLTKVQSLIGNSVPAQAEAATPSPTDTPQIAESAVEVATESVVAVVPEIEEVKATHTSVVEEPSATPKPTYTATATQTPSPTRTKGASTSTPVPDVLRSTATKPTNPGYPGKSSTAVPTHTTTATKAVNTLTPTPTPTLKVATPKPTDTIRPRPSELSVTLLSPASNTTGKGKDIFSWRPNSNPPRGQAFELVFWRAGEDPLVSGKGWLGTTTSTSISGDLLKVAPTESYFWGVLLVQTSPYKRITYLGGGWKYILEQ